MKTLLELADDYAKAYFMGRGEEARKLLQAAIFDQDTAQYTLLQSARAQILGLQAWRELAFTAHPNIDIDIEALVPATSDQLRDEYRSGLDSPDNTPEGEE